MIMIMATFLLCLLLPKQKHPGCKNVRNQSEAAMYQVIGKQKL